MGEIGITNYSTSNIITQEEFYKLQKKHKKTKPNLRYNENIKSIIKKNNHIQRLKDPTIKIKGSCLEKSLDFLETLNETEIYHHPSYYEKQKQKKKEEPYLQVQEYRKNTLLSILEDPTKIGLPKNSRLLRKSFLETEEEKNKIHMLMEHQDKHFAITLKLKDTKTGRKKSKKRMQEIKNSLELDYNLKNLHMIYVHGEELIAEELKNNFFIPITSK